MSLLPVMRMCARLPIVPTEIPAPIDLTEALRLEPANIAIKQELEKLHNNVCPGYTYQKLVGYDLYI